MTSLESLLLRLPVASPLPFPLDSKRCLALDLSAANPALHGFDPADPAAFGAWVEAQVAAAGADFAAGGYAEDRALYAASPVFRLPSGEARSIHLAIDLWLHAGAAVHAVADGTVHSTRDNVGRGDYGPTVILEHRAEGHAFYTLYGHLARESLVRSKRGARVSAGELIGWLGDPEINGGWAPHLHFQVLTDMTGRDGDHPGVCARTEAREWLRRCPDPNLLLRIAALTKS